jgi:Amt family ammonium transporter
MSDAHLLIGDDAEHGEEAYALWGDGEKYNIAVQQASGSEIDYTHHGAGMINGRGITVHT